MTYSTIYDVIFPVNRLFPELNQALYLDVDIIVREDITSLWQQLITSKKLIIVVERLVIIKI